MRLDIEETLRRVADVVLGVTADLDDVAETFGIVARRDCAIAGRFCVFLRVSISLRNRFSSNGSPVFLATRFIFLSAFFILRNFSIFLGCSRDVDFGMTWS